ncbi:MAG: tetratricopeptide repeat protein [Pseudomonadota bacterium]
MVEGDVFREVEQEMRREKATVFWQRYGILIVGAAIGIVAGVAGWQAYQAYALTQASEAGAKFEGAVVASEDGKADDARKTLEALAKDGPSGYQALARFRLAGELAQAGKTAEAVAAYDALAKAEGADSSLVNFAKVRAALLRVDEATFEEMTTRLGGLTGGDSSWRHSARETLGLTAYRVGKTEEATRIFNEILADNGASSALRQRAQAMLTLLATPTPAPAAPKTEASTPDAEKPETDATPEATNTDASAQPTGGEETTGAAKPADENAAGADQ